MLKLFRQKKVAVKALLYAIVLMVGAAMLVYLVPGATSDLSLRDPQGMVAQVGPLPLTQDEVQQHYQRVAEQFGAQNTAFKQLIMEQLIEDLVGQRLVQYEAARLGLEVSPEEVRLRLRQVPYLYPGGQFVGAETYRQIVERQFRMSVPQFEETLRQQTLVAKMFDWVTAGLSVPAPPRARPDRIRPLPPRGVGPRPRAGPGRAPGLFREAPRRLPPARPPRRALRRPGLRHPGPAPPPQPVGARKLLPAQPRRLPDSRARPRPPHPLPAALAGRRSRARPRRSPPAGRVGAGRASPRQKIGRAAGRGRGGGS